MGKTAVHDGIATGFADRPFIVETVYSAGPGTRKTFLQSGDGPSRAFFQFLPAQGKIGGAKHGLIRWVYLDVFRTVPEEKRSNMKPELIIFDCDGVLVDTERIANQVLAEDLAALGVNLDFEETVRAFKGWSEKDVFRIIEEMSGKPVPVDFTAVSEERSVTRFEASPLTIPGIEEALDRLDFPTCIASSGDHDKMFRTLTATGLFNRFEGRIFSTVDVNRGKPYPDLFLYAAEKMGAVPEKCVVIEDSVPGVQAGVAAGMTVLGYVDLSPEAALADVGAITFTSMSELPELIASIQI